VTLTFTPGRRSEEFTCPRDQTHTTTFERRTTYECTHAPIHSPEREGPRPRGDSDSEKVFIYFDWAHDTIREDMSRTQLDRLRQLLRQGYRISGVEGFTSPEGPMMRKGEFEGNAALGGERAESAKRRVIEICKPPLVSGGAEACFVGGPSAIVPTGRGELYSV